MTYRAYTYKPGSDLKRLSEFAHKVFKGDTMKAEIVQYAVKKRAATGLRLTDAKGDNVGFLDVFHFTENAMEQWKNGDLPEDALREEDFRKFPAKGRTLDLAMGAIYLKPGVERGVATSSPISANCSCAKPFRNSGASISTPPFSRPMANASPNSTNSRSRKWPGTAPAATPTAMICACGRSISARCRISSAAWAAPGMSSSTWRADPLSGLELYDITRPDDPRLEEFYALYGKVFTLPEEREPIDGFRTVLRLTADPGIARDFGPISERITVAVDPATGKVAGATNYVFYGYGDAWKEYGFAASCQLNFICVDQDRRARGIAALLLRDLEEKLAAFAQDTVPGSPGNLFITCEQNNPRAMTAEQLTTDLQASGMDPYDRLAWWVRRGYRKLDFAYRQPPLNPGQAPCDYLDYHVRFPDGATPATLPAAILAEHLRRFFFVSVGKQEIDMNANREWIAQRDHLAARDTVAMLLRR